MLATAQKAALAFGSYSYRGAPDQWVANIPALSSDLQAKLMDSAAKRWPSLREKKVVSNTTLTGKTPQIIYVKEDTGQAQVVVTTTQVVTGVQGKSTLGRSYALKLAQAETDQEGSRTSGVTWSVTAIVTN